ncbi:MAG: sugar phosphate isomerase/epimerase family protein [Sediminibacterium sp.]|jgi:sugar phosphate isomerase/epimerase
MKTRRDFLQLSSMGLLGASLPKSLNLLIDKKHPKLSIQLYTVRDQIKEDLRGTIKKIADLGFNNVETAFWPEGVSLDQAAAVLKEFKLNVSSCHIELPIGAYQKTFLATAKAFNCKNMIWHGWPEDKRYSSLEGTKELVKIYNDANKFAKANGLKFGLHNHWWEFRNKVSDKYVYEILLEGLDKDIFFEIDTYWVKVAGHDPAKIIQQFGDRVKLMHVKDGPALFNDKLAIDNPDPMTPVGQGTQNFPAIFKAASSKCEWLVIEMDKTTIDVFDALKQSVDFMKPYIV